MIRDDGRKAEAKSVPILEVAHRLGIEGLRPSGVERVGACPVCGSGGKRHTDRFAINPARGVFVCRKCSAGGDGIALVEFVLGCDFKGALDYIAGKALPDMDPAELARRKAKAEVEEKRRRDYEAKARARAIRDAREIWHAAAPGEGTAAEEYLAARGVRFPTWPPTLRFLADHPVTKLIDRRLVELHRGGCMIAAIQDAKGKVTAVHQTWLDPVRLGKKAQITLPDGSPAPSKMVRGSKKGGAIRLTPLGTSGVLIMGEGIETTASAIAAGIKPAAAFWAGVDLGNMAGRQVRPRNSGNPDLDDLAAWMPPEGITQLVFIQDGDSDPKSTHAKLLSGIRRASAHRPGLRGWIVKAAEGRDLNDMRMEQIKNVRD